MSEFDDLTREINKLWAVINDLIEPEVGRWITWTPTVDQGGAVAVTVNYARYIILNEIVVVQARLTLTGAGVAGNEIDIGGQPAIIEPANVGILNVIGNGIIQDANLTTIYQGALVANAVGQWKTYADGNAAAIGATPNFALASGDVISFVATYER